MVAWSVRSPLTFSMLLILIGAIVGPGGSRLHAEDSFSLAFGEGFAGDRSVAVFVMVRHDDLPIHGFSLALNYPSEVLTLQGISRSGTVPETTDADFFHQKIDSENGYATLGVIFSVTGSGVEPVSLAATTPESGPQVVARLSFDVRQDAVPGTYRIRFQNGLMNPPISNQMSYQGGIIIPELNDGTFVVRSRNVVTMESAFNLPGGRRTMFARARHEDNLVGYQVSLKFDRRALILDVGEVNIDQTDAIIALGGLDALQVLQVDFTDVFTITESMVTVGVLVNVLGPDTGVLPPRLTGDGQTIVRYAITAAVNAQMFGDAFPLDLIDEPERGAGTSLIVEGGYSVIPELDDGIMYFDTGSLEGRVLDFGTGFTLGQVTLTTSPLGLTTTTNFGGEYRFDDVPPGFYSILATKDGYFPSRLFDVEVAGGFGVVTEAPDISLFEKPVITGEGFRRGAVNSGDDLADITDAIEILKYLFIGGVILACEDAADVSDNGSIDMADAIVFLEFLFVGRGSIPAPFVDCGEDPTPDDLTCESGPGCSG